MLTFIIIVAVLGLLYRAGLIVAGFVLLVRAFHWVHESNPRLAWTLVISVVLMAGLGTLAVKYLKHARHERGLAVSAEAMQQRQAAAEQEVKSLAHAAEAERQYRSELVERWRSARSKAIEQWRQDLIDDQAVGKPGMVPPLLSIQDTGSIVTVTNLTNDAACVLINRIATRDSAVMARCSVGSHDCVIIPAGRTARLPTLRSGNSEICIGTRELEYRVGNVDHPEPSWWSESALNQFGSVDPAPEFIARMSDAALMTEIVRLEKQIEERTRVER